MTNYTKYVTLSGVYDTRGLPHRSINDAIEEIAPWSKPKKTNVDETAKYIKRRNYVNFGCNSTFLDHQAAGEKLYTALFASKRPDPF